jgi:ABC-type multidrug transport system fused ATPase/permease subunit
MEPVLFYAKALYRHAGRKLYLNLTGMVIASLLEGIGIMMLVPLLSVSGLPGIKAEATPLAGLSAFMGNVPTPWILPSVLGLFLLIVVIQNLLKRQVSLQNNRVNQGFDLQMKSETYRLLLQANWSFFLKRRKSDLLNTLTSEIARIHGGVSLTLQLLATVIFTAIQIGLAFWLSPWITFFVLVCGLTLALVSRRFVGRAKQIGASSSEMARQYLSGVADQMNGIKDIKTNTLEYSRLRWMETMSAKVLQEHADMLKLRTTTQLIYQISSAFLIAGFILLSVRVFHTGWEELLLIVIIFTRLWPRFTGFQSNMEQIASLYPAFRNVLLLQDECRAAEEFRIGPGWDHPVPPLAVAESLECRGVCFRYDNGEEKYALHDINLQIPANRMTAFVGRSGAGKSTLVDLIMGLMLPESGQVLVDGVPMTSERLLSLRRSIGYVPQDPFLFNDTIRENLLLVKPDASEEELWEALEFAACSEFVRSLPLRLDTLIGDRGVRLSGGERQRLVLARTILRKPSILVLDEATSALDSENEAHIQEAIERLKGKMTILVIAHRLSTIQGADQVVVIDRGRIVQKGLFSQLAGDQRSLFGRLLKAQQRVGFLETL